MTRPAAPGHGSPDTPEGSRVAEAAVVRSVGRWLADAVARAPADAWAQPAGSLTWSCRRALDHLLDDMLAYSLQLTDARTGKEVRADYLPVVPPRGGDDVVAVDPSAGSAGSAAALRAFTELFADVLAATPDSVRAFHPWGMTDRCGYAAVGLLELLVHGHDILSGLGLPADPPAAASARALTRLFPEAPAGEPAEVLLWSTGRCPLTLPDGTSLPRRSSWRPDASVRDRAEPPR